MENGYFLCADILGFSKIVINLSDEKLNEKINEWTRLVSEAESKFKIDKVQVVSDTVFAAVSDVNLEALVNFSRMLLNYAVNRSLPLRGAISYGQFNWGTLVYGPAVISAHRLEKAQNWIGIAFDDRIKFSSSEYSKHGLVCYPVPMPGSPIRLMPTLSWNVPKFDKLSEKLTSGGLTQKGELLDWDWGDKIGNTVLFGIYLEFLKESGGSPDRFYGMHPIDLIDQSYRSKNIEKPGRPTRT